MANQIRTALLLFVVSLAVFLAGNGSHGLWDRDEPRYCVATREMIETGDWIIPHFNGNIRYDKPVLIYWLMSVPMRVMGISEYSVRFTSALSGAIRVVLIFFLALRMGCNRDGALVASAIGGFAVLLMVISKASTIDSTLMVTAVAAMWLYWERVAHGFNWWKHLLFWIVIAMSVLLKGPPIPAVAALSVIAFHCWMMLPGEKSLASGADLPAREPVLARFGQSLVGLVVFLAWALPWVYAAYQAEPTFFSVSVGTHVIDRSKSEMEGHGGSILYYLMTIVPSLFPYTAVVLSAALWAMKRHRSVEQRFLWSWFLPGLVMFSLVQTKLPHYIAPLIPALAVMAGLWWSQREGAKDTVIRVIGAAIPVIIGLGMAIGMHFFFQRMEFQVPRWPFIIVATILSGSMLVGSAFWLKRRDGAALTVWTAGWIATMVLGLYAAFPALDALRPSKQLGTWIRNNSPPGASVMMVEYEEPTLVFYAGRQIVDIGKNDRRLAFDVLNNPFTPAALVTTKDRWEKYQREYRQLEGGVISDEVRSGRQIRAFYFEKGEWMDLQIVCNWPKDWKDKQAPKDTDQ